MPYRDSSSAANRWSVLQSSQAIFLARILCLACLITTKGLPPSLAKRLVGSPKIKRELSRNHNYNHNYGLGALMEAVSPLDLPLTKGAKSAVMIYIASEMIYTEF